MTSKNLSHITIGNLVRFRGNERGGFAITKFPTWPSTYVDIVNSYGEPCMILEIIAVNNHKNMSLPKEAVVKVLHNEEVFYVHESDLRPL